MASLPCLCLVYSLYSNELFPSFRPLVIDDRSVCWKQQSIMKLLIIIFIWVQSVLPYYLSKMLHWGFFFSKTGPYSRRPSNKFKLLCLQLWCCNRLWSGCFLVPSFWWIFTHGCYQVHVFWDTFSPWWQPSMVYYLFCLIVVSILFFLLMLSYLSRN